MWGTAHPIQKREQLDFSLFSSIVAGFLATVMMSLATELASLRGTTSMPTTQLTLGTFFSGDHELAMLIGSALHFVIIGSIVNGAFYGFALSLAGFSWPVAVLVGLVHGSLIGTGLGQLRRIHPRVVDGTAMPRDEVISGIRGELVVRDPGLFGVGWGEKTPAVLVGAYALYGLVFAFVYQLIA